MKTKDLEYQILVHCTYLWSLCCCIVSILESYNIASEVSALCRSCRQATSGLCLCLHYTMFHNRYFLVNYKPNIPKHAGVHMQMYAQHTHYYYYFHILPLHTCLFSMCVRMCKSVRVHRQSSSCRSLPTPTLPTVHQLLPRQSYSH